MDYIAISDELMKYTKGFIIIDWNEIITTEHRGIMVNLNLEAYFNSSLYNPDEIYHI